jgi:ABC-type lipoprotein release transport system permease subunit
MASVFFGVILSTVMTSMQHGSYESMIDNVVKFYSGYAQVFTEDYDENKTINNTFLLSDSLRMLVERGGTITSTAPRLEYFALSSSEELTKGAIIIGIDPERENRVTELQKWLDRGSYISQDDDGVLLTVNLARYLNLEVGDTLVLYGQGFHGVTAAGLFPVRGILEFPSPDLNNQMVYMSLSAAQDLFGAPERVSYLIVMVDDYHDLPQAMKYLDNSLLPPLTARSWDELQPELVQMIEADRAGGVVMKLILYMVVGFGILGTIIMMVAERKRELGVTIAIGMQRLTMAWMVFVETILTGLMGAFFGILGSIPVVSYFYANPIRLTGDAAQTMIEMGIEPYMYFSWNPIVFYGQALVVFIMTLAIAGYPVYKVFRLEVSSALRA